MKPFARSENEGAPFHANPEPFLLEFEPLTKCDTPVKQICPV